MDKKEFTAAALEPENKIFIVYVASFSFVPLPNSSLLDVHLFHRLQIASLIVKKSSTKISNKYINFADVFSLELMSELSKHTGINDHAIKLIND